MKDKRPLGTPKPGRGATPRGSGRAGLRPSGRSPRAEPTAETFWEGAGGSSVTPAERGGRGRRLRGRGMAGAVMGGDAGPDRKSKVGVLEAGWVFWGPDGFTPHPGVQQQEVTSPWWQLVSPCQEWEERRRQNIEKMNEEMEKIAEYERNQRVRSERELGGGQSVASVSPRCDNTAPPHPPAPPPTPIANSGWASREESCT